MEAFAAFMASKSIWVYVCIFFAETLYTSLSTLRGVLTNRGERVTSSIISFFEIMLWVVVTGTVLGSVTSDPLKIVVYAVAFATGIFLGSKLESRLALGTISMSIFLPEDETTDEIIAALKAKGYGATILDAAGILYAKRKVIIVVALRKNEREIIDLIHSLTDQAVISVSNVASIRGGYEHGDHFGKRKKSVPLIPKVH